jgi:hypothetical protein
MSDATPVSLTFCSSKWAIENKNTKRRIHDQEEKETMYDWINKNRPFWCKRVIEIIAINRQPIGKNR